jgi:hypothetical protein
MASHFEELQYYNLDWKAEQIAIDTFPGWKATWQKRQKKLEQQQGKKQACQASSIDKSDTKRLKDKAETSMLSLSPLKTSTTFQVAQVGLRLYESVISNQCHYAETSTNCQRDIQHSCQASATSSHTSV